MMQFCENDLKKKLSEKNEEIQDFMDNIYKFIRFMNLQGQRLIQREIKISIQIETKKKKNYTQRGQIQQTLKKLQKKNYKQGDRRCQKIMIIKYDQTEQENPENINIMLINVEKAQRQEYYDLAIQKNPDKADYQNNKAMTLFKMNKFDDALEYYNSAIQKNPEDADYYNNIAITLEKMNRFEEALEYYDSAIQKNPDNADYYNNKGINYEMFSQQILYFRLNLRIGLEIYINCS